MSLKNKYDTVLVKELKKELNIENAYAIPRLSKIVVNVGMGEALAENKVLGRVSEQLAVITGQKPLVTKAKVSISTFKLRAGDRVGLKVTLRNKRMYDFLEKLIRVVLPRMRDFRGIPHQGFDGRGNYSLGLTEQIIFPEIEYAKVDRIRGLEITFVTTADNDDQGRLLLQKLGLPFAKEVSNTD